MDLQDKGERIQKMVESDMYVVFPQDVMFHLISQVNAYCIERKHLNIDESMGGAPRAKLNIVLINSSEAKGHGQQRRLCLL